MRRVYGALLVAMLVVCRVCAESSSTPIRAKALGVLRVLGCRLVGCCTAWSFNLVRPIDVERTSLGKRVHILLIGSQSKPSCQGCHGQAYTRRSRCPSTHLLHASGWQHPLVALPPALDEFIATGRLNARDKAYVLRCAPPTCICTSRHSDRH